MTESDQDITEKPVTFLELVESDVLLRTLLTRISTRLNRDGWDNDAIQDVLLRLLENERKKSGKKYALRKWQAIVSRSIKNRAIDLARKERYSKKAEAKAEVILSSLGNDAEKLYAEFKETLDDHQRQVIELIESRSSISEISKALSCSNRTAYRYVREIKEKVTKYFEDV